MMSLLSQTEELLAHDRMELGPRAAALLEWNAVKAQLASHCHNSLAATAVCARHPFATRSGIGLFHRLADELKVEGERGEWPPLVGVSEMLELIRQPGPVRWDGAELVHIAAVAGELDRFRAHFLRDRARYPLWAEAANSMSDFGSLTAAVGRALDPDGRLLDGASPLLSRLRREALGQEQAVRHAVGEAMTRAREAGWTTGDTVTLRGDRYCLPLRSGDSRRIAGIVHDRSASGATLFVEPSGVVRLANDLAAARLETAAEELRILMTLIRAVEQVSGALDEAARLMLLLDTVRAPMLWSLQVRGQRPRLTDSDELRVCGGRHPLLLAALGEGDLQLGRERIVPLDLDWPGQARVLVISGPNAGGKSVALKSLAVFILLAQCGWDLPAREDTVLPLTRRLLADLGDDQSIAESLSSFSAHLAHLVEFMAVADQGTLVLCDEIGSGTDPQEGTALAFAALDYFTQRGARVLASTHFGLLKAAVHDHPLMVNAAMDYDERDLRPLFTFRVGDPGTSHAFDIASRMGFSADLLAQAQAMAGEERVQVERLLANLDRRARELASAELRVRQEAEIASLRNAELEKRLKGLDKETRAVMRSAHRKAEDLVSQGRRAIENAVREIKSSGADRTVVKSARDRLEQLSALVREPADAQLTPSVIVVGQRVEIPHLALIGRVVEVRGNKLVALADGLRLNLTRASVVALDGTVEQPVTELRSSWALQGAPEGVGTEIDLRGETGEDGWQRLDHFLDRAIPSGLEEVTVIHGFGTGRLRDHLLCRLRDDDRVASFAEAPPGRGGGGATVVTLSDT